jgi:hypothetical protein
LTIKADKYAKDFRISAHVLWGALAMDIAQTKRSTFLWVEAHKFGNEFWGLFQVSRPKKKTF